MYVKTEIPRQWKTEFPMSRKVEFPTLNSILPLNNTSKFEGEYMVKKTMYKKIKQLKHKGYSKSKVSSELQIDRKTVIKYWNMSEKQYQDYLARMLFRSKEFDQFRDEIIEVYAANEFKKLQGAAVFDYLEEKYGRLPATEKSLRNYIHYLTTSRQLTVKTNVIMEIGSLLFTFFILPYYNSTSLLILLYYYYNFLYQYIKPLP